MDKEVISLADAAKHLEISWDKCWTFLLRGQLRGRKVNGHWFVELESIEELQRRTVTPVEVKT